VILSAIVAVILVGGLILCTIGLIGFCPPVKPEVCMDIYNPVFGIPTSRMHANSCLGILKERGCGSRSYMRCSQQLLSLRSQR